ncbi:autotransporter-associated beta strand repeat-containing protein, partial [Acetobacter sp. DsW_063]|uniref:beta strand repeat-containing protein n=1 Tax=Acetobacter sp. DsW_063 TaxID=1514894 RepID=UPI000B749D70
MRNGGKFFVLKSSCFLTTFLIPLCGGELARAATYPAGCTLNSTGQTLTCSSYTGAGNSSSPLIGGVGDTYTSVNLTGTLAVTSNNASSVIGYGGADSSESINNVTLAEGSVINTTGTAISLNSGTVAENNLITINGTITSTELSTNNPGGTGSDTIQFDSDTTVVIGKNGAIYSGFNADKSANAGAVFNAEALNPRGGGNIIINYGLIETNRSAAIWFQGTGANASATNTIENYGTITAGGDGSADITGSSPVILGNSASSVVDFTNETGGVINGNITLGTNKANIVTLYNGSTINGNLQGGGDAASLILTGDSGGDTLQSTVQEFGTLTKTGDGTWIISNPLSNLSNNLITSVDGGTLVLDGTTTVKATSVNINQGGTLQLGNGGTTGFLDGDIITNNGTLVFDHSSTGTPLNLTGDITGSGNLVQDGTDTMILSGSNTYTGTTTITGTKALDGSIKSAPATLQIGDGGTTGSISNSSSIVNDGHLYFDRSDTYTVSQSISGNGDLHQIGLGTLILTGDSNYGGITYIDAGTLQLGNGNSQQNTFRNPTIVDNGILSIDYSSNFAISQAIFGSGGLTQMGTGTTTINGSNTDQITYTGATTISDGRLALSGVGSLAQSSGVHD